MNQRTPRKQTMLVHTPALSTPLTLIRTLTLASTWIFMPSLQVYTPPPQLHTRTLLAFSLLAHVFSEALSAEELLNLPVQEEASFFTSLFKYLFFILNSLVLVCLIELMCLNTWCTPIHTTVTSHCRANLHYKPNHTYNTKPVYSYLCFLLPVGWCVV